MALVITYKLHFTREYVYVTNLLLSCEPVDRNSIKLLSIHFDCDHSLVTFQLLGYL
jgi:hypothetical protein